MLFWMSQTLPYSEIYLLVSIVWIQNWGLALPGPLANVALLWALTYLTLTYGLNLVDFESVTLTLTITSLELNYEALTFLTFTMTLSLFLDKS